MSASSSPQDGRTRVVRDRRRAGLLGASGLLAAVILALGINGTLGAWTSAVITNTQNSAAAVDAVALSESSGGSTCVDTATTADNTAVCSTINKYGGVGTPLAPGGSQSTTVTLANTGTGQGALTVDGGTCTATPSGGADLCNVMQVLIECPASTVVYPTSNLNLFGTAAPRAVSTLAAGASVTCTFTVSLPANAPATVAGQTVSQPIVWTLSGA